MDNVQSLHKQFLLFPVIIIMNALSFVQTILPLQVMIALSVQCMSFYINHSFFEIFNGRIEKIVKKVSNFFIFQ